MALAASAAAVVAWWLHAREQSLHHSSFNSGWMLLIMVLFLASYNIRKRLTFLPLGASRTWLQWHIYAGLISIVVFGFHIRFRIPDGALESVLGAIYSIVAFSGVIGLFFTRVVPSLLSVRGEEVIFERIPGFLRQLRDRARGVVAESLDAGAKTTLSDYYRFKIADFFEAPRHYWHHLFQSTRPRVALLSEISSWDRYLGPEDQKRAAELADLVRAKDDLDYHYALQRTVKVWLFAHIGLTYALILIALVHAFLAHVFYGGVR